jgi:hypothetical protein
MDQELKTAPGSVLYELPYLWKSVDNEMVSPRGFSGCKPHKLPAIFPKTAGHGAQGISPGTKKKGAEDRINYTLEKR